MTPPEVMLRWLGETAYLDALAMQRQLRGQIQAGAAPDTVLLTTHRPVITLGRNAGTSHLHAAAGELERRGIALAVTERGGDVTYHGPGQLVAYPILDLTTYGRDVRRYVWRLEECAMRLLDGYGLAGQRSPGRPGVWCGGRKIASVGVHISRWVTMHGIAINVDMDLEPFALMDPCGFPGLEMTTIAGERSQAVPLVEAARRFAACFAGVFGCTVTGGGLVHQQKTGADVAAPPPLHVD